MNAQSNIFVATANKVIWIRIEGKGSFQNSSGMKEFAREMIQRGHREFVVDLKNCQVMDSTFMGTLAGIALKLRELGHGEVRVVNLNARNADLLRNLGLDQLMTLLEGENAPPLTTIEAISPDAAGAAGEKSDQAQTMLEAHEALVEAHSENLTKFKDVLEYLKQDLNRPPSE